MQFRQEKLKESEKIIRVTKLAKKFGKLTSVDNISFDGSRNGYFNPW